MTRLPTPAGYLSYGAAINDSGQVVGSSGRNGSEQFAYLYSGGALYDLSGLVSGGLAGGTYLRYAAGINDNGWIVAEGSDAQVYVLTPNVPEPRSFALLALGVGVLAFAARRGLAA